MNMFKFFGTCICWTLRDWVSKSILVRMCVYIFPWMLAFRQSVSTYWESFAFSMLLEFWFWKRYLLLVGKEVVSLLTVVEESLLFKQVENMLSLSQSQTFGNINLWLCIHGTLLWNRNPNSITWFLTREIKAWCKTLIGNDQLPYFFWPLLECPSLYVKTIQPIASDFVVTGDELRTIIASGKKDERGTSSHRLFYVFDLYSQLLHTQKKCIICCFLN